jgi:tRNA(Phe) wybutosine-synthesizing methylase Tyw3
LSWIVVTVEVSFVLVSLIDDKLQRLVSLSHNKLQRLVNKLQRLVNRLRRHQPIWRDT